MKTAIADAVSLRFPPLAIFYAQEPSADGKEAKGMCSMIPVAIAAKGDTVYMSATSCSCSGAAFGFGLADLNPDAFPGGKECYDRFLSIGNEHSESGR